MRDPHTHLQKREFATSHSYFFQDPACVSNPRDITADGFTRSDGPTRVAKEASVIATQIKEGWGDQRKTHSLPPGDRFLTESRRCYVQPSSGGMGPEESRRSLPYSEFTRGFDEAKLVRSTASLRGGLRSTGRIVAQ